MVTYAKININVGDCNVSFFLNQDEAMLNAVGKTHSTDEPHRAILCMYKGEVVGYLVQNVLKDIFYDTNDVVTQEAINILKPNERYNKALTQNWPHEISYLMANYYYTEKEGNLESMLSIMERVRDVTLEVIKATESRLDECDKLSKAK